jgi:hypothetical protein
MPYSSTSDGSCIAVSIEPGNGPWPFCATSHLPMSAAVVTTAPEPFTAGPPSSSGRENHRPNSEL